MKSLGVYRDNDDSSAINIPVNEFTLISGILGTLIGVPAALIFGKNKHSRLALAPIKTSNQLITSSFMKSCLSSMSDGILSGAIYSAFITVPADIVGSYFFFRRFEGNNDKILEDPSCELDYQENTKKITGEYGTSNKLVN